MIRWMTAPLWIATLVLANAAAAKGSAVRINEISDKGTFDGTCGGNDWIELHLPESTDSSPVNLTGFVLHDDNGPEDEDAYEFDSSSVMNLGDYLVLCCDTEDGVAGPRFKIGGDDAITLRNATSVVVSTTGQLTNEGSVFSTYMFDEASGQYAYTGTPTPGRANVRSEPISALYAHLDAQNEEGIAFFDMDNSGLPVETGFAPIVDLRMEMDPVVLAQMMEDQSFEVYVPFLNATVTGKGDPDDVLLELPNPGRIRPRGQSTLAVGTCLNISIPFGVDWDHVDKNQTLFGAERTYLRNHLGDDSYVREWVSHRMLARFGLPHLRTRTVRFFLNSEYVGMYSLMEAPDQDYVFRRSFGDFDPNDYALYKMKTMASTTFSCEAYSDDLIERAEGRLEEAATPPYAFERGYHRNKVPVLGKEEGSNIWTEGRCMSEFIPIILAEIEDAALAYVRAGKDCGKMLVEQELVDRDIGVKAWDDKMEGFINRNLKGGKVCEDAECSNSNLALEVDVDNWLRNFAVYAAVINQDSPMGNGNNYLLAQSGDGRGWKIVQYDHNNILSNLGELLCDQECGTNAVHWSIERPTCQSLDSNALVGPLLTDPDRHGRYMDLVREFVTTVMANSTFLDQIRVHVEAIQDDVMDDPWVVDNGNWYGYELAEDNEWMYETQSSYEYVAFLPALRARSTDILQQLEAHDSGAFPPRDIDDIQPSERCVDWRSEEPGEGSACPQGCYYDSCYRLELPISGACDVSSGICFQGQSDAKCFNISDGQGYEEITSFKGSDQPAFCVSIPLFGPAKLAPCLPPPAKEDTTEEDTTEGDTEATKSNDSVGSSSGYLLRYSMLVVATLTSAFVAFLV